MISRRRFLVLTVLAWPAMTGARAALPADLPAEFARIERENGGRLGVAVLDAADGTMTGHRLDERFPMCSTFKFLLAAAVLAAVGQGRERLDRAIAIPPKPLLPHSPLTEPYAGDAMSVSELCHAILTQSDNTAANLLLASLGTPAAITAFARSIGDKVTRLDRMELELNESLDGDARDTTTPAAMVENLRKILLGDLLASPLRERLTAWMEACATGRDRLRKDLPDGWRAADKTGTNGEHTSNDIAVFWPPSRPPLLVAAYVTRCPGPEAKRAAILAEVGRLVRRGSV